MTAASRGLRRSRVAFVKAPARDQVADNGNVSSLVSDILRDVAAEGDDAVRRYSERFDNIRLEHFEVSAADRAGRRRQPRPADPRRHRVRHRERAALRRGAAGDDPAARDRAAAGRASRPSRDPDRARRRLCARRPLPAALRPDHDHRAGQGRRLRRGRRLPAAQRAPGDDRRLPSLRRRPHLPDRRRAGDRGHGLRHRERAARQQDHGPWQRLRERGQAPGVRPGRHRPARRPVRDLRRRRQHRRRRADRHRPAGAGGA